MVAFLFYKIQYSNLFESYRYKLRNFASEVSQEIITSHMSGNYGVLACLQNHGQDACFINKAQGLALALYDKNLEPVYKEFDESIDFLQKFIYKEDSIYYIDESVKLHLDIKYVVTKQSNIQNDIFNIYKNIAIGLVIALVFVTLLGIFLAKMFLRPIKNEIEALDKFIKDSTHELNTPITAILMSVSRLNGVEEKKRKRIEQSAKRIANLYHNLTYMLFSDKTKEAKELVDMATLLQERLNFFDEFFQTKRLRVEKHIHTCTLTAQKEAMLKLIDNLLSNAIKYNVVEGSIEVRLNAKSLEVKDSGIGIAKEQQKNVFKRYKRANEEAGGFGIGLDIVSTICKNHKFRIYLDSEPKKGTTIRVNF